MNASKKIKNLNSIKSVTILFTCVVFILSFYATADSRKITDMAGRTVEIPETVNRVVGLEAGSLRLLVYLEATDMVVGVENFEKRDDKRPYILAHPELQELPSVGPIHGGEAELIVSAGPDVIIRSYITPGKADDLQKKTGVPVVVIKYGGLGRDRDLFFSALRTIGEILGKKDRARELIDYTRDTINDLKTRAKKASGKGPTIYVGGIGHRGSHGITSTEPAYEPFEFLEARNVASSLGVEHAMVSEEKILQWNPEIIFVDRGGGKLVRKDLNSPTFSSLSAVQNEDLYALLPFNYYTTNFGTVLGNAYFAGKIIYPEAFSDIDPEEKIDRIYRKFLGEGVYSKMTEHFGPYGKFKLKN